MQLKANLCDCSNLYIPTKRAAGVIKASRIFYLFQEIKQKEIVPSAFSRALQQSAETREQQETVLAA